MSDWTTDPAEIPPNGERQDMTLSDVGFARNHSPDDDNPTKLVIQCVIDNGEYEGFRLSNTFLLDAPSGKNSFKDFIDKTGLTMPRRNHWKLKYPFKSAVRFMRDSEVKIHRFSALVGVEEVEKESERLAVYNLTGFDQPQEEASLVLQTEPRQFYRE